MMDEVGRFLYWSDRAIRTLAEENGVELQVKRRWTFGLSWKILQATLAGGDRTTRNRLAEAQRLERRIGNAAIEDFDEPPPAAFVKGVGKISFARFRELRYAHNYGALLHIQTRSRRGRRVDLCLFGSMDNVRGFGPYDRFDPGWTSSAAPAIGELLVSKGQENTSQWDDDEARAVEALKIALHQGITGTEAEHVGKPETRGLTIGHSGESEFFAEVYTDVVLDRKRWRLIGDLADAERIIVGRPLWVRTMNPASVVSYAQLRDSPRWAWWRRIRGLRRGLVRRRRSDRPNEIAVLSHLSARPAHHGISTSTLNPYPHLARWMVSAPDTHPLRELFTTAQDTDDPTSYRRTVLQAYDSLIDTLETAKPLRLPTVRGDFQRARTGSDLLTVRAELVAGAKLARAGVAFDFGARKGQPEPDLVLRGAPLAIEVKARRLNGLQDLEDELEHALNAIDTPVTVHLACDARPLFIKPADRAAIIKETVARARSATPSTFTKDLQLPSRATSPMMRLSVRVLPHPPIGSRVLVDGGWELAGHLQDVEGEVLAILEDKQKRRQAEAMPTILLVDAARTGLAWLRPPGTWARRLADQLPDDTPFVGIAVMIPTLDNADAPISLALRASAPPEALFAAGQLAQKLGLNAT